MQEKLIFRGLPHAIACDGWWLDQPEINMEKGRGSEAQWKKAGFLGTAIGLLALVALADILFWERDFGVSLSIFAVAIFAVACWDIEGGRNLIRPGVVLLIGALPAIDSLQALSLAFLAASLIAALIWSRHPKASLEELSWSSLIFFMRLPLRWLAPFLWRRSAPGQKIARLDFNLMRVLPAPKLFFRNWAFPIGGTLVFLALLMEANPMLSRFFRFDMDLWALVERAFFWTGVALLIVPFLSKDFALTTSPRYPVFTPLPRFGINAGSVLRALVMFNLLIAVQMIADISILIGGAALPSGMSYADYAHRGAYPLLATAVLAGAFALVARPFLGENRLVRPLILLWLAQNVVLCGAAALRLELYVDAYGLTYLRIYALIWMGLVAVGLGLTLWQVLFSRGNQWLLVRAIGLSVSTLYLCGFVNFAQLIASQNLTAERPDLRYVCDLGPMAAGALADAIAARPDQFEELPRVYPCATMDNHPIRHWQEWGFRKWKVDRYIAEVTQRSALNENPDRR